MNQLNSSRSQSSIHNGYKLFLMVLRTNLINIALIFSHTNVSISAILLLISIIQSSYSNYLILNTGIDIKAFNYYQFATTLFPRFFVSFFTIILQYSRISFTLNHFLAIIPDYDLVKTIDTRILVFFIILILLFLHNYYKPWYSILPLSSAIITILFTATQCSDILKTNLPKNKDFYFLNDLGLLSLWLSSQHNIDGQYKSINMKSTVINSVIISFFLQFFAYFLIGFFGIKAYPNTESIWINNLDNPSHNIFTSLFLGVNIPRLPGMLKSITKDTFEVFNRHEYHENILSTFFSVCVLAISLLFASSFSKLQNIRLCCLIAGTFIISIIPSFIAYKKGSYTSVEKVFIIMFMLNGFAFVAITTVHLFK